MQILHNVRNGRRIQIPDAVCVRTLYQYQVQQYGVDRDLPVL